MSINFDEQINRCGSNSVKWDARKQVFGKEDVLPLWVADMDFACPPAVVDAVVQRAKHPIYGYPTEPDAFYDAASGWLKRRFNADVPTSWMTSIPGVVPGIRMAIEAFTKPGDKIIIQPPVYPPFFATSNDLGRRLVENPLIENNGYYTMDLDDLEKKIDDRTKMLVLCSPHNPIGRVWTKEELEKLGDLCVRHNILIIADEIHSDLVFEKGAHTPFYTLSEAMANQCLAFISGSKTFNIAGLFSSIAISKNPLILKEFEAAKNKFGHSHINIFGIEAMIAAYTNGDVWLDELNAYLKGNAEYISEFLQARIPEVKMAVPEGTYLGWLDFRGLDLKGMPLKDFIINEACLGLNDGVAFGKEGEGFQRINFGCPRAILKEAMERLEKAVQALKAESVVK
ncbi:MalY/PatB family protein [Camelliibacillus cellulosilyticus]|uniref:cysteine-S-conjugate beta-lyase n=1 Tax=Camelliibacillus cellulosilyticus TaxID=2174486 RepID=A0ABV9GPB5_9BACL